MAKNIIVKEQRVDGNYSGKSNIYLPKLRCTLTGCENNYPIKYHLKQLNVIQKYFSTLSLPTNNNISLNPYFITGLVDGEGTFSISIQKNNKYKTGWRVLGSFQISFNIKDEPLILKIQEYFKGVGSVFYDKQNNLVKYQIAGIDDLIKIVIPHFDKYPLISQKSADFLLFKEIILIMQNKGHLKIEGLLKIINIKASMNLGLSEILLAEFTNLSPVLRPSININKILDPNWIAGFTCGEGNFDIGIKRSKNKIGYQVIIRFRLCQHERDINLLEKIKTYFNCGRIEKNRKDSIVYFTVMNLLDINDNIIPFFKSYKIVGDKDKDFNDWCSVANLMTSRFHLTKEGLNQIKKIKLQLNRGRKNK